VISAVIDRISRVLILHQLDSWRHSRIEFHLPDGTTATVGDPAAGTVDTVDVHDDRVFRRLLLGGSTGVGEAYVDGQWSSPDLQGLVSRMLQGCDRVTLDDYLSWPRRLLDYVRHTFRPNSRQGSAQNIHAHYDLGNEFF
jgi:cyclopropane-fatty-acyl-phospholipid synthase